MCLDSLPPQINSYYLLVTFDLFNPSPSPFANITCSAINHLSFLHYACIYDKGEGFYYIFLSGVLKRTSSKPWHEKLIILFSLKKLYLQRLIHLKALMLLLWLIYNMYIFLILFVVWVAFLFLGFWTDFGRRVFLLF